MADTTLEIVAQIRDLASAHLRRIGSEGQKAGQAVASGMATAQSGAGKVGESVTRLGREWQGMRKLAGGALAGVGAGMAAAQAGSENLAQAVVRVGTSLATGFAAGGPVGMALAGAGILIGSVVGETKKAEEQAQHVAEANAKWSASVRELTAAYREQASAAALAIRAAREGVPLESLRAAAAAAQQRETLVSGSEGMPGLLARRAESRGAEQRLRDVIEDQLRLAPTQQLRRYEFGDGKAEAAAGMIAGGDVGGAARALTEQMRKGAPLETTAQEKILEALREYEAALRRVAEIEQTISEFDKAQAKQAEADAATQKRADADKTAALVAQAEAMAERLTMSEDDLRFAKESAMVADLRAKGEIGAARNLEDAMERRREMDRGEKAEAAQRVEDERTQAVIEQAEARERYLALSREDQAISSDLAVVEELRRRGETERADRLESAVRAKQASDKSDRDAEKARATALENETELLAAQRDLIVDRYDRERQAAIDRAAMAKKAGGDAEQIDKILALDLQRIESDRARTKAEINREAERELDLARATSDVERERVRAQQEYLDNLERGVEAKTAEALLSARLATIESQAAEDRAKEAEVRAPERRRGRPPGAPERGVFGAFSGLGAEAMTRREREARERKMAGLAPVARMWNGQTVEEYNAQRAAKKAAVQPAAQAAEGPATQAAAAKVQQAVEQAAAKIPNLGAIPDPTPFIKKAGDELAKVPPLFDKVVKAQQQHAERVAAAIEAVGAAAASAVERVGSDVRELAARVRRVEDRLAAAGKGGV